MSENDIKPVLWELSCEVSFDGTDVLESLDVRPCPDGRFVHIDDYQSAIDRLKEELDDYAKAADFLEIEMAKFQIAADEAKAERDAAVAALDRIVSLKISMFKDPWDMIGECVNIAAEAIEAAMAEAK